MIDFSTPAAVQGINSSAQTRQMYCVVGGGLQGTFAIATSTSGQGGRTSSYPLTQSVRTHGTPAFATCALGPKFGTAPVCIRSIDPPTVEEYQRNGTCISVYAYQHVRIDILTKKGPIKEGEKRTTL
jgi:hypothetical protein